MLRSCGVGLKSWKMFDDVEIECGMKGDCTDSFPDCPTALIGDTDCDDGPKMSSAKSGKRVFADGL
jgi:hypothetical protein